MADLSDNLIKTSFIENAGLNEEEKYQIVNEIFERMNGIDGSLSDFLVADVEESEFGDIMYNFFGTDLYEHFDILQKEDSLEIVFISVWNPLLRFGENLTRLYPQLKYENIFYQPRVGDAGKVEIVNGNYTKKELYSVSESRLEFFEFLIENKFECLDSLEYWLYLDDEEDAELYNELEKRFDCTSNECSKE